LLVDLDSTLLKELPASIVAVEWMLVILLIKLSTVKNPKGRKITQQVRFRQKHLKYSWTPIKRRLSQSFLADPNRNESNLISFLMAKNANANVLPSDFGYVNGYFSYDQLCAVLERNQRIPGFKLDMFYLIVWM
jgi:hypothetical protein